jgi:hypothetical protein
MTAITNHRESFGVIPPLGKLIPLSTEQTRFLALHARQPPPYRWRWILGDSHLRAYCESGHSATLVRAEFDELCEIGLLEQSGNAGAFITAAGREALR